MRSGFSTREPATSGSAVGCPGPCRLAPPSFSQASSARLRVLSRGRGSCRRSVAHARPSAAKARRRMSEITAFCLDRCLPRASCSSSCWFVRPWASASTPRPWSASHGAGCWRKFSVPVPGTRRPSGLVAALAASAEAVSGALAAASCASTARACASGAAPFVAGDAAGWALCSCANATDASVPGAPAWVAGASLIAGAGGALGLVSGAVTAVG